MVSFRVVKLILQAAHSWAAWQLGGHHWRADLVALVVEGIIIDAIIAVGFAAWTARFGDDIVPAEDGIVFKKVREIVVVGNTADDAVHGFGDGDIAIGSELADLVGRWNVGSCLAPGRLQLEFLFYRFSGGFGESDSHAMGIDAGTVRPDERGNDMDMRMIGVLVTVYQVRLFFHFK